jgi:hypothetical protein
VRGPGRGSENASERRSRFAFGAFSFFSFVFAPFSAFGFCVFGLRPNESSRR